MGNKWHSEQGGKVLRIRQKPAEAEIDELDEQERRFSKDPAALRLSKILWLASQEENPREGFYKPMKYTVGNEGYVENLLRDKRRRKRMRYSRVGMLVAGFAAVVVLSGSMVAWINNSDVSAVKGKFNQITKHEVGSEVSWQQGISSVDDDNALHFVYEEWEDVASAKKAFPGLYIPQHQPENFKFKELTYDKNDKGYRAEYLFINEANEKICIVQTCIIGLDSSMKSLPNCDEVMNITGNQVSLLKGTYQNTDIMTFYKGNDRFDLFGPVAAREEMIKIIERLEK